MVGSSGLSEAQEPVIASVICREFEFVSVLTVYICVQENMDTLA